MQLALVEDDPIYQQQFQTLLKELPVDFTLELTIFNSGEQLLVALEQTIFTAIFLDIKLGAGLSGMDTAKKIRQTDPHLPLVFLSNYDDYVFDGYDVGATGYVMKPISAEKLTALLLKIQKSTKKPTLAIQTLTQGLVNLPLFEIMYLEITGHTLHIVTQRGEFSTNSKLSTFDDKLSDNFLQVHRSFKVNLAHVVRFLDNDLVMQNGDKIPVARSQKQNVKMKLLAHYRRIADDNQ
ncbi:LytR/AlgR family response regulator transcription factor [Enterococcus timonensis]|uniref:LytR/AlgR family response regulator transcription factor n=1 Tax=Enterococcus timonensis TaxID=1852364 RepID=UPI0008D91E95|nr:LytTR family DNA-binding domain-containing protein [Enterococcus timonensis]